MSEAPRMNVSRIFLRACDLAADQRDRYLDRACGGDAALRDEVESLLARDAAAASVFDTDGRGEGHRSGLLEITRTGSDAGPSQDPVDGDGDPILDAIDESLDKMGQSENGDGAGPSHSPLVVSLLSSARATRKARLRFERSIQQIYGIDPWSSSDLDRAEPPSPGESRPDVHPLRQLPPESLGRERTGIGPEIARGGMGTIRTFWDRGLRRRLAQKDLLPAEDPGAPGLTTPKRNHDLLCRFLEEAQVTAQLDHPGIVPVHELGLDSTGCAFFTMKLVKGTTLQERLQSLSCDEEGWTRTRALTVLLKACEAVAYAHEKGVIHRDLKPANVMLGHFGEVYVMDWGLAHVLGKEDRRDIRLRPRDQSTELHTLRSDPGGDTPGSPLITMDGTVVGTPAYMPPEQASGKVGEVDKQSDVYSVGAMLYEILTGRVPYLEDGEQISPHMLLARLHHGPPPPIRTLEPQTPPELEAICEKAMARSKEDRYSTTVELAEDLRAFLENRVVQAYRTGAMVELRKWVQRNKGLAAALAVGFVLLLGLGVATSAAATSKNKAEELDTANRLLETSNDQLDSANAALDVSNQQLSGANTALSAKNQELDSANAELNERNQLLGDLEILRDLREREERLWPARPWLIADMEDWLRDAAELLERVPTHERELAALLEEAIPVEDAAVAAAIPRSRRAGEYADVEVMLGRLDDALGSLGDGGEADDPEEVAARRATLEEQRAEWSQLRSQIEANVRKSLEGRFVEHPAKQGRHDELRVLVNGARALQDSSTGLLVSVEERRDRAARIEQETTTGKEHEEAWDAALKEIALSKKYDGLDLDPIMGLVPIGADPDSGLWEFWHFESGSRPKRDPETERIVVTESMGMVLVLIPGGTFWMGAESDPANPNHDPVAVGDEGPVHEVTLAPYLLSKFELTQGQWFRMTGDRPSQYKSGKTVGGLDIRDSNPVTNVSWEDCHRILPRFGLRLPTEAQWERAARAESSSPWWCGDRDSIAGPDGIAGNVLDRASVDDRGASDSWGASESWDDGHSVHAPVGSFRPNRFGLHDVIGNVWESCEDLYFGDSYRLPWGGDDGHRLLGSRADDPANRACRGGGFDDDAVLARSAERSTNSPSDRRDRLGVRAAQGIEP